MRPFVFLLTLWDTVFVISMLYFTYFVQLLACYKGKKEPYNPLRNPFLKNTTMASKKFAILVWISSNYNTMIFSNKKSENSDSYKHG